MTEQTQDKPEENPRTAHIRNLVIEARLVDRVDRLTEKLRDLLVEAGESGVVKLNSELHGDWIDALIELKTELDKAIPRSRGGTAAEPVGDPEG